MKIIEKAKALFRTPRAHQPDEVLSKYDHLFDEDGRFIPDPVPMAPPVGYNPQPSMVEIVRDMVRSERLAQDLGNAGFETFEESEDFDIDDEPGMPQSQWENEFDPPLDELLSAGEQAIKDKATERAPLPAALEPKKPKGRQGAAPRASQPPSEELDDEPAP